MRARMMQLIVAGLLVCVAPAAAVAQLAARPADEWIKTLEAPNRVAGLKIDEVIARLKPAPGQVIADLGAGTGLFALPFAAAVAPGGRVYAVEVEQGLVEYVAQQGRARGLTNLQAVEGKFDDPNLPSRDVDLAFIHDVLHHIENRETYLRNLKAYLKPDGRIAVIDFIPERGGHKGQPELQVGREQADALMAQAGFTPIERFELFDDKWFVVYGRR